MKALASIVAILVLSLAVMARPQGGSKPSDQSSPSQSQTKPSDQSSQSQSSTNQKMTGTVSKDGKSFTNDADNKKYKVDNPDALQGHEGQQVSLILALDPTTNTVHIIQVGGPQ